MSIIIIYVIAFCYVLTKNILQNHQKVSQVTPFDGISAQLCHNAFIW